MRLQIQRPGEFQSAAPRPQPPEVPGRGSGGAYDRGHQGHLGVIGQGDQGRWPRFVLEEWIGVL